MPISKYNSRIKYTNVFWHNNRACFSLMSQAGVCHPCRGRAGPSKHQMCPCWYGALLNGLSKHLSAWQWWCKHDSFQLECCSCEQTPSWSHRVGLGKEFLTGIHFMAQLQAEDCRKEFTFRNYVTPWTESFLFQFCTTGRLSSFLFLFSALRDVSWMTTANSVWWFLFCFSHLGYFFSPR